MNLKKFKNKTKNSNKDDKVVHFDIFKSFEYLKVTKVINYYTIEVIMCNNDVFNKWFIYLKDIDLYDDKLSDNIKLKLTKTINNLLVLKYFKFKINKIIDNNLLDGIIYVNQNNESLNSIINNIIINSLVKKEKLRLLNSKYNSDEGYTLKTRKNRPSKLRVLTLETISEEYEG